MGIGQEKRLALFSQRGYAPFRCAYKGQNRGYGQQYFAVFSQRYALKNRTNIVLNPNGTDEDAKAKGYILAKSLDELFAILKNYDSEQTYVIGGAMMYRTLLPYCDTAYVTKVDADGDAEVFHENLDDMPNWQLVEQSEPIDDNGYTIRFCTYKNNAVKS